MATYLVESHFGSDTQCIGFPNLLLCMGLVVATDSKLYGVHIDDASNTKTIMEHGFKPWLTGLGVDANDMKALYGSCNWNTRWGGAGGAAKWQGEMKDIATILGYRGEIRGLNTASLVSKHVDQDNKQYGVKKTVGMYVEYHLTASQGLCKIFYKKNWKMDAPETLKPVSTSTNVVQFDFKKNALKSGNLYYRDVEKADLSANSKSGSLNEVRHDLKQFSFTA